MRLLPKNGGFAGVWTFQVILLGMLCAGWGLESLAQAPATKAPAAESSAEAIQQFRLAVPLQNKGNYDLAVEEWETFLKQFPQDPLAPKARYYAGVCYQQLKQYDQAQAAYEQVLKEAPKFEQREAALFNLGLAMLANARTKMGEAQTALYGRGAETLGQLVADYPQSGKLPDALFNRADALYLLGKKEEAVEAWRQLYEKFATSPLRAETLYNIGVAQQELKQMDGATASFAEYLKQYAKEKQATEVSLRLGLLNYERQQFAEAEKYFAVAAAAPGFPQADFALLRQGDALLSLNKSPEAAAAYSKLATSFPQSEYAADAMLQAGKAYYLAGNQAEARAWLAKLTADPAGKLAAEAAHWQVRSYLKENQPQPALALLEPILAKTTDPERLAELQLDRAECLYMSPNQKTAAQQAYAELAEKFADRPQGATALYMAAQSAMELGDYATGDKLAEQFLAKHAEHALRPFVQFVAAECALLSNDAAKADERYKQLLEQHAGHEQAPFWRLRRGWTYLKQKQYDQAARHYTALLQDLKQPAQIAEAQYLLGNAQLESNNLPAAISAYQASLAADAQGRSAEDALLNLARAQRAQPDLAAAQATLSKLLETFPQSKQADRVHYRLGELRHAAKDYKAASAEFGWILQNTPQSPLVPEALLGQATAQAALQDYTSAQKLYTQLISDHAGHALAVRAFFGRAGVRIQQQDYAGAAADLQEFLQKTQDPAEKNEARYLLGYAQAAEKKYDDAIKTLGQLIQDQPDYANLDKVLYELGWAQQSSGKKEAASQTFGRLVKDFPKSPHAAESAFNVGEFAYQEQKDYPAAAQAYTQALSASGAEGVAELALHKLGWAYFQQNDFVNAAKRFEEQISKFPQGKWVADGQFMGGECLFKQQRYDAALPLLEKAVSASISSPVYKELALAHAAQAASQLKKWDLSLKLGEQFLKDYASSAYLPEVRYEQAWSLQNQKQLDAARQNYEAAAAAATKLGKNEIAARSRFMLGELLFEKGEHKDAIKQFYAVAYGNEPKTFPAWQANSLYEAARCFEVLKNTDNAKKLYDELVATYPDSDKVDLAKQRLAALK
ncbi:MAG: tetratricopeptide repeat protein [Pirellulales bacterium]|nr:tetratricopeptide repeat protein [Pirellulales bacterium]